MALAKMINSTECFIFYKTRNSASFNSELSSSFTESPWICNELLMANLIKRRSKSLHRSDFKLNHFAISESSGSDLAMLHDISFNNISEISMEDFLRIIKDSSEEYYGDATVSKAERFLDKLYKDMNITPLEVINE